MGTSLKDDYQFKLNEQLGNKSERNCLVVDFFLPKAFILLSLECGLFNDDYINVF